MGQIIILDNSEDDLPDVLTSTGQGGFLSSGTLQESPATAALEGDERAQFVLTNGKYGVTFESETRRDEVRPGKGYRTIGVVTDRRLVILVGGVDEDGDHEFAVPHAEIEQVETTTRLRHGELTIRRTGGATLTLYCGTDGLDTVTTFLDAVSQAWVHTETVLEDIRTSLVEASDRREDGDIAAARAAVRNAFDRLSDAEATVSGVPSERAVAAMERRVETVSARAATVDTRIRRSYANQLRDEGEQYWRDQRYEAAYDTFEAALDEYEAALSHRYEDVPDVSTVQSERDRLRETLDRLSAAPIERAEQAAEAAAAADEPEQAVTHWEIALERYRTAMGLDWGADERRFDGDPAAIRDRLGEVAQRLTETRRTIASDKTEAGDWYAAAGQYDPAIEEFEAAREAFENALETAHDCYPDAVEHLRTELDAVEGRIERAQAELTECDDGSQPTSDRDGAVDETTPAHAAGENNHSVVEK
ncbi:hypothetical protein [Haloarcula montana]|uniref:hypothetical protein n=1 Tax=Haloarcula montana TaxID=3111776 RepID=UPI002D79E956|nr:hypothetical protein [Haloarcula sp. GH36]